MPRILFSLTALLLSFSAQAQYKIEQVRDINQVPRSKWYVQYEAVLFQDEIMISLNDERGWELWKTVNNKRDFEIVKDINSFGSSKIQGLFVFNNAVYFRAYTHLEGYALWKSDGTEEGTQLVKAFGTEVFPKIQNQTIFKDQLFFAVESDGKGVELWKSDGTSTGTGIVKDINAGTEGSNPSHLTVFDDHLFFTAEAAAGNREIWVSDGSKQGTRLYADINFGVPGSNPEDLLVLNNTLFFTADNGINGKELWMIKGQDELPVLLVDMNSSGSSNPGNLTWFNNELYFTATNDTAGTELWHIHPGKRELELVPQLSPGAQSSDIDHLQVLGNQLFFTGRDDENGNELRVLHVDSIRPSLTKNLRYKSSSADIDFLKVLGDKLLFEYRGSWYTSDGTEEGTFSLNIPAENDRFGFFLYDQDGLYFLMEPERNEPGNATVWKLDASTLSTQYIGKFTEENESSYPHDLLAINDKLLFFADAGGGSTLYSYDAKSDDLQELFSLNPEMNYNNHNVWTEFKGEYYIIASKEETGNEIWKTDGTAAGTRILKDINPGPESGVTSTDFYFHNGLMYFSAKTETHGKELWVTDGTEAGTRMVMDYAPGEVGSNPLGFTVFDNKIFLSLFDTNEVDPWLIRNELVYTEDNFNTFHKLNDTWSDSIYNVSLHPSMARGDHLYFWSGYGAGELYSIEKGNYQVQRVEDLYLYNREPIVFNGETYLQLGGDAGLGVWKINTEGGLYKLCDCTFSSDKVEHIVFNDLLFFNGSPANNSGNSELWVSDGTPEGTREFMDINQVSRYGWMPESDPRNFFKWGDRFVFKAREDEFGWELWISDGTQAGTHILIDHNQGFWHTSGGYELAEYDGDLYLGLDNAIAGNELMKITRCSDFPEPQISIDKPYLKVDPIYDSYLWHECKDYTALPADNQHEIWPHQDQEYRVLVQKDGCWAMSSCAQIEPNSIVESKNSNLELYPNPVLGSVFRVNTDEDFHEYSIFSASGQLMSSGKIEKSSKEALEFDVSHMASGLYLIQLKSENTRESTRFVIP